MLTLTAFDYHLPKEQIAQEPARPRDHSRLMLINRATQEISHHHFYDLPTLLPKKYAILANNTKVFPARVMAHKETGGKLELLLLKRLSGNSYTVIAKPGIKVGDQITISPTLNATVTKVEGYTRTLKFGQSDPTLTETLAAIGTMPTPPYIKKMLGNSDDYQTIYAKYGFSAAAPTAGLHFTPEVLKRIKLDHPWHELTLNVGLGTFLPVKETDLTKHAMHEESYSISPTTSSSLQAIHNSAQPLLSVGTTTLRALESSPALAPGHFSTNIFIYPPYQFRYTDALLTNFHLPKSTLLMLVSAFASYPNTDSHFTTFTDSLIGKAYTLAVREQYRFFSFGDAMLIL